jgi:hypothetical protein
MQYADFSDRDLQESQEFLNFMNYLNDSKDIFGANNSSSRLLTHNNHAIRNLLETDIHQLERSNGQKRSNNTSSSNHDKNKNQNLEEIFKCFICFSRVRQPQMCPHCSKLCCSSCIKKWLSEKSQCPHCRGHLKMSQLVNCRFVSEITTVRL